MEIIMFIQACVMAVISINLGRIAIELEKQTKIHQKTVHSDIETTL